MPINALRRKELNHLLPGGTIVTRSWLMENGFSRHAIDNLVKSQQLEAAASGVYTRWEDKPTWQGITWFLQKRMQLNLTIGGLSALDMLGFSHYLSVSLKKKIHLYGTAKLPAWVNGLSDDMRFEWHSEWDLLGVGKKAIFPNAFLDDPLQKFTRREPWKDGKDDLLISSPERALLEILTDVPKKLSFAHADQLMQGMTNLSPRSLQPLLEECKNVKVRRLFFWLAGRHKHTWLEKLQPELIDLGSGKRMLVKGGKLDKKYNITIPEFL
jgi:hypothetical protein